MGSGGYVGGGGEVFKYSRICLMDCKRRSDKCRGKFCVGSVVIGSLSDKFGCNVWSCCVAKTEVHVIGKC